MNHLNSIRSRFHEASVSSQNILVRSYRTNALCYLDSLYPRWSFVGSWQKELEEWPRRKQARASASPLLRRVDNLFEGNDCMLNELMDHTPFPLCKFRSFDTWETQASRYGQEPNTDSKGQFYTWHSDRVSGDERADSRLVSFVYYIHSQPKRFEGGNLELSNGLIHHGKLVSKGASRQRLNQRTTG